MIKDLETLANDALSVQSACNLSGVAHSLSGDVIPSLRAAGVNGSKEIAEHPVTRLFVTQIAHLSGIAIADPERYYPAYEWCAHEAAGGAEGPYDLLLRQHDPGND